MPPNMTIGYHLRFPSCLGNDQTMPFATFPDNEPVGLIRRTPPKPRSGCAGRRPRDYPGGRCRPSAGRESMFVHMDVQTEGCVRLAGNRRGGRLIGDFCWLLELKWNGNLCHLGCRSACTLVNLSVSLSGIQVPSLSYNKQAVSTRWNLKLEGKAHLKDTTKLSMGRRLNRIQSDSPIAINPLASQEFSDRNTPPALWDTDLGNEVGALFPLFPIFFSSFLFR
jgi:hypothetical protein